MPGPQPYLVRRLTPGDHAIAQTLFSTMAAVFEEAHQPLSATYVDGLLAREDFWALAAFTDADLVGGLTAHELPMTRTEASELFIYDIAVRAEHQRRGIGRELMRHLRQLAGARDLFVAADDDDVHALDFYRALGGAPSPVTVFTFDGVR